MNGLFRFKIKPIKKPSYIQFLKIYIKMKNNQL